MYECLDLFSEPTGAWFRHAFAQGETAAQRQAWPVIAKGDDALVIAPCTGATLARLAAGLSDTPVALAAKSLLRAGRPVVVAVSTNDGLGASGENIARLMQRKHFYFVPFGQDDPVHKPQSLKADLTLVPGALAAALEERQIQPVLLQSPLSPP